MSDKHHTEKNFRSMLFVALCMVASIEAFSAGELSLRNAILKGAKVILEKNIDLTANLPLIPANKTVTIKGSLDKTTKPVKINGLGRYTIFRSSGKGPVTLSLVNLVLTNSKPSINGAVAAAVDVRDIGSVLRINKLSFTGNAQAVYFSGRRAAISDSQFSGHTKSAVLVESLPPVSPPTATFSGCNFTNNTACSNKGFIDGGGAIRTISYNQQGPEIFVSKTTFVRNTGENGGAVHLDGWGSGTFSACTFHRNAASQGGGALRAVAAYLKIQRCSFSENKAAYGGALSTTGGRTAEGTNDFSRSTFLGNFAKTENQGGAFWTETILNNTFCRCNFKLNTANGFLNDGYVSIGGTMYFYPPSQVPLVTAESNDTVEYLAGKPC